MGKKSKATLTPAAGAGTGAGTGATRAAEGEEEAREEQPRSTNAAAAEVVVEEDDNSSSSRKESMAMSKGKNLKNTSVITVPPPPPPPPPFVSSIPFPTQPKKLKKDLKRSNKKLKKGEEEEEEEESESESDTTKTSGLESSATENEEDEDDDSQKPEKKSRRKTKKTKVHNSQPDNEEGEGTTTISAEATTSTSTSVAGPVISDEAASRIQALKDKGSSLIELLLIEDEKLQVFAKNGENLADNNEALAESGGTTIATTSSSSSSSLNNNDSQSITQKINEYRDELYAIWSQIHEIETNVVFEKSNYAKKRKREKPISIAVAAAIAVSDLNPTTTSAEKQSEQQPHDEEYDEKMSQASKKKFHARFVYTPIFKKGVIDCYDSLLRKTGKSLGLGTKVSRLFNVSHSMLSRWLKAREKLATVLDRRDVVEGSKRPYLRYSMKRGKFPAAEKQVLSKIEEARKAKNTVKGEDIKVWMIEAFKEHYPAESAAMNGGFKASEGWRKRFRQRHNLNRFYEEQ